MISFTQFYNCILRFHLCWALCASLIILSSSSVHAEVTAQVNSTEVTTEQSLTLTISSNTNEGAPDLTVLETDFEILGTSTQSQTQITGDKVQQLRSWVVELLPKREGIIEVPSLTVGKEVSRSIRIAVSTPQLNTGNGFGGFKVDVEIDNDSPYVQSQVIFTIRVYYAVNLLEGNLSSPEAEGVVVERLGDDKQYQETVQGKRYRVLERKFALFPQKSGSIQLPPIVLDANVPADGSNRRTYFTPTRKVRRKSEAVSLDVLRRPAGNNAWWLPAKSVTLQGRWEGDVSQVRVGESLTRSVALVAAGVDSTQLPEIEVPTSADYKIYVDQPELGRQPGAVGIQASRIEKWAIVARNPGALTLPEIQVPWFNTATEEMEIAVLPTTTIEILPAEAEDVATTVTSTTDESAAGETATNDPIADSASTAALIPPAALTNDLAAPTGLPEGFTGWKWVALAALAAWLITSGFLARLIFSQRNNSAEPRNMPVMAVNPVSLTDVQKACKTGDLKQCAAAIVAWGRGQWPDDPPATLVALASRVESPELAKDLNDLDSALYAGKSESVQLDHLANRLSQSIDARPVKRSARKSGMLPKL